MTEEGQRFLQTLHEYLGPILGSATAAGIGYFAGKKKNAAEIRRFEADAEATAMDSITKSFQTLIDGYERRIDDLTQEVIALRAEIVELRQALDQRPRLP